MSPQGRKTTLTGLNHALPSTSTSRSPSTAHALLGLSLALLESALDLLTDHLRTDAQMTHKSELMPGGTPGKHLRHVIETFQAFLRPLQPGYSSSGPLQIDYDAPLPRSRSEIARSHLACVGAVRRVRDDMRNWGERCDLTGEGALGQEMGKGVVLCAVTPTRQEMASSLGRELWFCSLHAIHHFSMLRTIAVHELGLSLPIEFGTAPSTLLYRGDQEPSEGLKRSRDNVQVKSKL